MEKSICSYCSGDGIVEHICEDLFEKCEHCNGTGNISKQKNNTFLELVKKILMVRFILNLNQPTH